MLLVDPRLSLTIVSCVLPPHVLRALAIQPEPDFTYSMFDHGLTELFVGAPGGINHDEGMHGDELQQVGRSPRLPLAWLFRCFVVSVVR